MTDAARDESPGHRTTSAAAWHHLAVPGCRPALLVLLAACGRPADPPVTEPTPVEPVAPRAALVARDAVGAEVLAAIDQAADPCVDFYQYACGGWLQATQRPGNRPRHMRSFDAITDRNNALVRQIFERAAAAPEPVSAVDRQLGAFWSACMDEDAIEAAGLTPIAPLLAKVADVRGEASLWRVVGELHPSFATGTAPLFTLFLEADARRPDLYVAYATQGGLGLPEREFYLQQSDERGRQRGLYERHVATMLGFLGEPAGRAAAHAAAIVGFETELARRSLPLADLRDAERTYNPLGVAGLQRLDPGLPWSAYFAAIGAPSIGEHLVVMTPEFFEGLGEVVRRTPVDTLQAYLRWHILRSTAPALGRAIVAADQAFTTALTGSGGPPPRWERCVRITNVFDAVELSTTGLIYGLGEMVGQAFVRERFTGDSKALAQAMLGSIKQAFADGLPTLEWMDADTRARALTKLSAMVDKIGHPDAWRSFEDVATSRTDHLVNVLAWRRHEFAYNRDRIGKPVDRGEWWMPPALVNAYYQQFKNEMVFTAGILQPPFFSVDFPMSINFGAIGMVMGHELSHGFDDQGRKYDEKGTLRAWWEPGAVARFEARAGCIRDLYDGVEAAPGVPLDGSTLLGENIADFGGVKLAHAGYRAWRAEHPDTRPIDGLSDEQLFFLGYAQIWCTLETPESQRLTAAVEVHSPPRLRVNLPLQHLPAFAEAWQCAPGTPMRADRVCEVW